MIFIILYRTIFFYFVVIISYKIMGKRELGELSIIDFVISMLISQIIAIGIENYKSSIWYVFLPIVSLVFLQVVTSFITLKNKKIRSILDGNESLIIKNGKLNFKEMVKQRYNLNDLFLQLREKSIKTIEEVDYAILESNGKLSIFEKKNSNDFFPLPIIIDGKIELKNLNYINKNELWIKKILKNKKILLKDVFYAFYKNDELYIIKN